MNCAKSKKCPVCGKMFVGRKDKRFCSAECRTFYHNERRYWKRHYAKFLVKRAGGLMRFLKSLISG